MYTGPERRRHHIVVTDHTEYHLRDRTCIAVRQREGAWRRDHAAVGSQLVACMATHGGLDVRPSPANTVGARLYFSCDLMTSPVRDVRRPSRQTAEYYVPLVF